MLRSLESSDASVQGTNDDAQISKLSCSKAGYFRDEFIQYFVRRASRRSPLINRGYYSRHAALRQLLECFLSAAEAAGRQPQVLVLGAGFDTTWFQLRRDKGREPYKCLEVDFKEVTQRKAAIIAKEPALRSLLGPPQQQPHPQPSQPSQPHPSPQPLAQQPPGATEPQPASHPGPAGPSSAVPGAAATGASSATEASGVSAADQQGDGAAAAAAAHTACCGGGGSAATSAPSGSGQRGPPGEASGSGSKPGGAPSEGVDLDPGRGHILSPHYCLLPVDLRDLATLEAAVRQAGLDFSAPTYILSECVLVYMDPQHSAPVVGFAARAFPNSVMAIYEQIRPDDAFGRQMVSNLEMRGCPLRGLPATPSLEAHRARMTGGGWGWADAQDMDTLYRSFVDAGDRTRVERLELFDELEEWHMIQEHYCIALGRNDRDGWLRSVGFNATQSQSPKPQPSAPPPLPVKAGGVTLRDAT